MRVALVSLLAAACGGAQPGPAAAGAAGTSLDVHALAAGVGVRCAVSADCATGLTCTDLAIAGRDKACDLEWPAALPCPDGFMSNTFVTADAGAPVDLSGAQVTGHFCEPWCKRADGAEPLVAGCAGIYRCQGDAWSACSPVLGP